MKSISTRRARVALVVSLLLPATHLLLASGELETEGVLSGPCNRGSRALTISVIPQDGVGNATCRIAMFPPNPTVGKKGLRLTEVAYGDERFCVPEEAEVEYPVRAHDVRAQPIHVNGERYLLHLPPGRELSVGSHYCRNWSFSHSSYGVYHASELDAFCIEDDSECDEGFVDPGPPRPASDPLCTGLDLGKAGDVGVMRCVRTSRVRLAEGAPCAVVLVSWMKDGSSLFLSPSTLPEQLWEELSIYSCRYPVVSLPDGSGETRLVVGYGEDWTLQIENGVIEADVKVRRIAEIE